MNFQYSTPISGKDYVNDVGTALAADELALTGSNNACTISDLSLTALATPAAPVITQGGTGASTHYSYVVADVGNAGVAASAATQTTGGAVSLTTTNYNIISWSAVVRHTYNIYRSLSSGTPSGTGLIGTVVATSVASSFNDTGITATAVSNGTPTGNNTGAAYIPGMILGSGLHLEGPAPSTQSGTAAATLTVANVLTPLLIRSGTMSPATAYSDTTPTAAALVAAVPGVKAGMSFTWRIFNSSSQTQTITNGSGVTMHGTCATATVNSTIFTVVFTTVTIGSEAVDIYSGPTSAY